MEEIVLGLTTVTDCNNSCCMCPALVVNQFLASKGYTVQCTLHRWARYFKKVAERALALALYKAFKAIAALKKKF